MATLRETLQADLATAQAKLTAAQDDFNKKQTDLANLETTAPDWLSQEMDKIKSFFTLAKQHLGL